MDNRLSTLCPVCGYDGLENGSVDCEICPCCGTEFGYSDSGRTHEQLRNRWITQYDSLWWSLYTLPPLGWSAAQQLRTSGYI